MDLEHYVQSTASWVRKGKYCLSHSCDKSVRVRLLRSREEEDGCWGLGERGKEVLVKRYSFHYAFLEVLEIKAQCHVYSWLQCLVKHALSLAKRTDSQIKWSYKKMAIKLSTEEEAWRWQGLWICHSNSFLGCAPTCKLIKLSTLNTHSLCLQWHLRKAVLKRRAEQQRTDL